ncbi:MAG: putative peptidoglycan glycosyltransferase FtsW [Alphaproteobacteria bacterium]|nr:putative peptidoglycan glycosyltransferase FtsW [Alphaproteobacteria bacterium]
MPTLARTDQTVIGKWWWTVDRWSLSAIILLMGIGILLIQAATPAVAVKHGLSNFYFVERHLIMLVPACCLMFGISLLTSRQIRTLAIGLLLIFLPLLAATLFIGVEIKGASRWIHLPGISIQPSEFIKPIFAIVAAWLFSRQCLRLGFPGFSVNSVIYLLIVLCLLGQPDIGMTILVSMMWFGQFFLAGMPMMLAGSLPVVGIACLFGTYYIFPHFASRFDRFLNHSGDTYQTDKALEAFTNGGLFGTGPGSGTVKMSIPDAHADFIFAVAGEELGLIGALVIVFLFAFIVLRGIWRLRQENNLFILLAVSGLLIEFGVQTAINLGSTLHIIPAKGMTLPFISYGGSSLWAMALEMGLLLALTRKRYGLSDL